MTGEQSHQTGPEQDDDFYVLGEEDSSEPAPAPGTRPSQERSGGFGPATGADEEDVLFSPTDAQKRAPTDSPFYEKPGTKKWSGTDASAEDIGIPVDEAGTDAEPFTEVESDAPGEATYAQQAVGEADSGEYQAVEANAEAEQAGVDEGEPLVEEAVVDGASEGQEPTDEAWSAVEGEQDPLLEAPGIAAAAEEGGEQLDAEGQQDYVEAEEVYGADLAPAQTLVAAGGTGRGRRGSRLLAAAVVLLACGGGGYYAWEQGLLEGEKVSVVERAEIPRPRVSVTPDAPPQVPSGNEPDKPVGSDPTQASQPTQPNVVTGPDPVPGKGDPKPVGGPDPIGVPTLRPDSLPQGTDPVGVQVGDGLTIKEAPVEERAPVKPALNGIVPGSQAFAQLRNGNFFVGNVKTVDTEVVTLKLEKGEVTLAVLDLKTIVPLASSEYQELKKVEQGFVRLNNRNRLLGTILASQDENIILENKANRVVIPKAEIEELGAVGRGTVRFTEEDSSWVDRLVEKQMREREAESRPSLDVLRGKADKAKVRSRIEDDPASGPK